MSLDIAKARQFVREKERKRREKLKMTLKQAQEDFQKITQLIIEKYDPARIYQWGSLLDEAYFSEISDIDIALEGVTSAEIFFQLYGDVMKMTDFPLDIVQMEKIEPEFRESIIVRGKLIYERK